MGIDLRESVGVLRPVRVGRYALVGTGSILMPVADVGECSIVGAGSVVRGRIEPYSVAVGNPCVTVGDSREYVR